LTTQVRFSREKSSLSPIVGNATFTIEASRTTTNCAIASSASARHFWRSVVYRHFPNKDALVGELIRLHFERLAERAERWWSTGQDQDPWEVFEGFVRETAEDMATGVAQQRMIWESSPEAFTHAVPAQRRLQETGAILIERAQRAGKLRSDFTVTDMPTVMCSLGSAMLMETRGAGKHDWRRLLEIVLDGIRGG